MRFSLGNFVAVATVAATAVTAQTSILDPWEGWEYDPWQRWAEGEGREYMKSIGCPIVSHFNVVNFVGQINSTDKSAALKTFSFHLKDKETESSTFCTWDNKSPNEGPRYLCQDKNFSFAWNHADRALTCLMKYCKNDAGVNAVQVSATANVPLVCDDAGWCMAQSTNIEVTYTHIGLTQESVRSGKVKRFWRFWKGSFRR